MALGNVHLTPQLVQAVRDAVDIVDIASDNTRLRKAGRRYSGLCPLHKEKTPSFSVDPEQGLFYCFGCGRGGDAIKLHMLLTGDDFPGAIETLARRYGIPLPRRSPGSGGHKEGPDLEPVLEAALEFFKDRLRRAEGPRSYLERRRISREAIESFELGYAPDGWRNLSEALHPGIPMETLTAAGLATRSEKGGRPYDRFRHRLMFPIRAPSGRLLGFGGRALGDDKAKYINTNETTQFQKGRILYGLDRAKRTIRETGKVLLVEGYFDVIGAVVSGVDWTVAGMGTALTPEQAKLLSRFADEVVVGYDGDAAGEKAFRRCLPILLAEGLGVRRCDFGEGHDPDSLRLESGPEAVRQAVEGARDGVVVELERRAPIKAQREPRTQAKAAKEAAELLAPIPDAGLRYGYAKRVADRLNVPIEVLLRRLGGAGARRAEKADDQASSRRREVSSLEERVLHLLLVGDEEPPPAPELPPAEAFLLPSCRNIFAAYRDLYRDGSTGKPDARTLLARLEGAGEEVDHLARLLLEGSLASRPGELGEGLRRITRRWRQQRLREFASEIHQAQQEGDDERIERLVREKTDLSRELHGRQGGSHRGGDGGDVGG